MPASGVRNDELLRFVERFALILSENGIPRMAARVFAFALADDADRYTASELAEGLRVSPAAVSGAVRFLVQTGLLGKEREPGSRSDTYRVYDDDVWGAITRHRLPMLDRWAEGLADGLERLDPNSPGWRRLRETQAYFEFVQEQSAELMERWAERRRTLFEDDQVKIVGGAGRGA
ncbi:MAG TPA: MarR family transcriptional regulator [Jiangellaceae bacterium]|nr:MarR family transcriptional regulator [Jiangellaceae bacterium]